MNPLLRGPLTAPCPPSSFSLLPFFIRDCSTPVNPSYLPFSAFLSTASLYLQPPSRPSPSVALPATLRVLSNLSCQAFISSITNFFQAASTCCTGTIDIMNSALFPLKACRQGERGARGSSSAKYPRIAVAGSQQVKSDLSFLGHLARACKSKSIFRHQLVQRARNNSRLRNIECAPRRHALRATRGE